MGSKNNKDVSVEVNTLVGHFLRLLQRDGAITNSTYLESVKMLKEDANVDSN